MAAKLMKMGFMRNKSVVIVTFSLLERQTKKFKT